MDPDGTRAFVGCTPDNYVLVIDLKKLEVVNHINVGGGPDGLAWAVRKQKMEMTPYLVKKDIKPK